MARRSIRWLLVAALFTLVNVAGLAFALFPFEKAHAIAHLTLVAAGLLWVWELMSRNEPSLTPADAAMELAAAERLEQLERSLGTIADEVDRIGEGQRQLVRLEQERIEEQSARERT